MNSVKGVNDAVVAVLQRDRGEDNLTQILTFLSHPDRLRILNALQYGGEATTKTLQLGLQKRQAYVSQQLAVLREAGVVTRQRKGQFVYYTLAPENLIIKELLEVLQRWFHRIPKEER